MKNQELSEVIKHISVFQGDATISVVIDNTMLQSWISKLWYKIAWFTDWFYSTIIYAILLKNARWQHFKVETDGVMLVISNLCYLKISTMKTHYVRCFGVPEQPIINKITHFNHTDQMEQTQLVAQGDMPNPACCISYIT